MKRFKRTFRKGNTKAGKDALKILRNPDNLIQMFGEDKGKQIAKEWSPCCGLCRITGFFVDADGQPVIYNGDLSLSELAQIMNERLNDPENESNNQYIVHVYSPGNFAVLGSEQARKDGNCTPEHINEQFGTAGDEDTGLGLAKYRSSSGEQGPPLLIFNLETLVRKAELCPREWLRVDDTKNWHSDVGGYLYPFVEELGGAGLFHMDWLDDPLLEPSASVFENWGLDILGNPVPTGEIEDYSTAFRAQRDLYSNRSNERFLQAVAGTPVDSAYSSVGTWGVLGQTHWRLAPLNGIPVGVQDPYIPNYGNIGTNIKRTTGWYRLADRPYGCDCPGHAYEELGPLHAADFEIAGITSVTIGSVTDVNDLPTTGSELVNGVKYWVEDPINFIGFLTWVSDDCYAGFGDCYGPLTTNPAGRWCEEPLMACSGQTQAVIDSEDCFTSQRVRRDGFGKGLQEFVLGLEPMIWSNYYLPRFQVETFKI